MDIETRRTYIEQLQKDINSQCFSICHERQSNTTSQKCSSSCLKAYLQTLQATHQASMALARRTSSPLFELVKP